MKKILLLFLSLSSFALLTGCWSGIVSKEDSNSQKITTSSEVSRSQKSLEKDANGQSSKKNNDEATTAGETESHDETSQAISSSVTTTVSSTELAAQPAGGFRYVTGKYGDRILIVNKKHPLPADYAPGENPTARAALLELIGTMQNMGYAISNSYSGFRSYDYQASLYQSYVARDGQAAADRYSARPGYSEHQTGLAFDLLDSYGQLLEEPQAVAWLSSHAHEYGFIVRYLSGKEAVTGYMPESWHLRYIGSEAVDIYNSGLTLEEYFGVSGGSYE